jgi:NO-binding membrane sensor protein with MHYT domain
MIAFILDLCVAVTIALFGVWVAVGLIKRIRQTWKNQ